MVLRQTHLSSDDLGVFFYVRCSDAQDNFNVSDVKSSIKMNGTHLFLTLLEMTGKSQCFVFFKKKSSFFFTAVFYFYTSRLI